MSTIEQVQELVSRTLTIVNKINRTNQRAQVKIALRLLSEAVALRVRGTGPVLKILMNEMQSASEALDLSDRSYVSGLDFSELKKAPNALARLADAATSRKEVEDPVQHEIEQENSHLDQVFRQFKSESTRVDIGKKPFGIFRVPLVAITTPPLRKAALDRVGIKSDEVAQYVVLHNQLVFGISKSALQGKEKPLDAAERIADMIGNARNTNIVTLAPNGVPYKGAVWYWMAEDHVANRLMRAANNSLRIAEWGFAFN